MKNFFLCPKKLFIKSCTHDVCSPLTLHCLTGHVLVFRVDADGSLGHGNGGKLSTYLRISHPIPS